MLYIYNMFCPNMLYMVIIYYIILWCTSLWEYLPDWLFSELNKVLNFCIWKVTSLSMYLYLLVVNWFFFPGWSVGLSSSTPNQNKTPKSGLCGELGNPKVYLHIHLNETQNNKHWLFLANCICWFFFLSIKKTTQYVFCILLHNVLIYKF